MSDALEEYDGKVSTGGRNLINLRSADDIAALAEEKQEVEALVESLDKILQKVCAEKTKLMTKQRPWHPERDKGNRGEARYRNKLQVPWGRCFRRRLQTRDSLKDCTSHCSSYKVKASLER